MATAYQDLEEAYELYKSQMQPQTTTTEDGKTTFKEMPGIKVYHIQEWTHEGAPYKWHVDTWHVGMEHAFKKMALAEKREGRPVWVLPGQFKRYGVKEVVGTIHCQYPGCPGGPFHTPEEARVHLYAAHRQFAMMEKEREERENRERELAMLRKQNELNQQLIEDNRRLMAEFLTDREGKKARGGKDT